MMMIGIVFLVFVAVLIPLTAVVGVVYVGWLAEKGPRPDEAGLPEVTRDRPPRLAMPVHADAMVRPH